MVNKKAEIVRVYLPPDANCLLSVGDHSLLSVGEHCLRSRDYVNVVVAGKQPALDYLPIDDAIAHCTRGLGIWPWASNDDGEDPDVVLACAADIPTLETLAAAAILRDRLPDLKVRFINVVDLMRLQDETELLCEADHLLRRHSGTDTIAQEEIFGPVLSIMPYDDEEHAISLANDSVYGLAGGVWSGEEEHAKEVARRFRTGQVEIDGGAFNPLAPFGGYEESGRGRELGKFGLEEFLEVKSLRL